MILSALAITEVASNEIRSVARHTLAISFRHKRPSHRAHICTNTHTECVYTRKAALGSKQRSGASNECLNLACQPDEQRIAFQ